MTQGRSPTVAQRSAAPRLVRHDPEGAGCPRVRFRQGGRDASCPAPPHGSGERPTAPPCTRRARASPGQRCRPAQATARSMEPRRRSRSGRSSVRSRRVVKQKAARLLAQTSSNWRRQPEAWQWVSDSAPPETVIPVALQLSRAGRYGFAAGILTRTNLEAATPEQRRPVGRALIHGHQHEMAVPYWEKLVAGERDPGEDDPEEELRKDTSSSSWPSSTSPRTPTSASSPARPARRSRASSSSTACTSMCWLR